jgi:hypothetical protein
VHSENTRRAWFSKAERVYLEVENLTGLEQAEAFKERIEAISDQDTRAAVQMQVWYWIGHGKESSRPNDWLTTNRILAATFFIVFSIGWFELGATFIWSATIAFVTTVILRVVFRLFDRGFMFRRLFTACVGSGLFLIAPAQLQFAFDTPLGPISWGGSPGGALVMIWTICTLLTFGVAVWEHFASDRT